MRTFIRVILPSFLLAAVLTAAPLTANAQSDPWFPIGNENLAKYAKGHGCATWAEFSGIQEGMSRKKVMKRMSSKWVVVSAFTSGVNSENEHQVRSFKPCKRDVYSDFAVEFIKVPGEKWRVVTKSHLWAFRPQPAPLGGNIG